ncbi:MAG: hypothetical protein GY800_06740 [Planctomycetes bacterium]|nr:hypothetical protein [Planctomycetota bacterium]
MFGIPIGIGWPGPLPKRYEEIMSTHTQNQRLKNEYTIQTEMAAEYRQRADEYNRKADIAQSTATAIAGTLKQLNIEV